MRYVLTRVRAHTHDVCRSSCYGGHERRLASLAQKVLNRTAGLLLFSVGHGDSCLATATSRARLKSRARGVLTTSAKSEPVDAATGAPPSLADRRRVVPPSPPCWYLSVAQVASRQRGARASVHACTCTHARRSAHSHANTRLCRTHRTFGRATSVGSPAVASSSEAVARARFARSCVMWRQS